MPDLIRTPGEIKTMLGSVFMTNIQESEVVKYPNRLTAWFKTLLIEDLEHEIFSLLCEEEWSANKKLLNGNRDFVEQQIEKWRTFKRDKKYIESDIIRDWLIQIFNINPNEILELV